MFPVIKHIDDVLPHIADKPEIARIERDGYTVLDYIYAGENTFDNPFARECRGLKFDSKGDLIGRPFHKFFNLNEKEETKFENQNWNSPVIVANKWDGSMIHPALVNGELVFMTRKGVTDVAIQAMNECEYDADEMIRLIKEGFTPIYEFVSPNNKIVLHYDKPELIPINLRHRETGKYDHSFMKSNFLDLNLDENYFRSFFEHLKAKTGIEGVVVQFYTPEYSRFIKFKADDYVALHRVLDETTQEKNVLALIMDDKLDDVVPLIDPARAEHLKRYSTDVNFELGCHAIFIVCFAVNRKNLTQKEYAEDVKRKTPNHLHPFLFKARNLDINDVGTVVGMFKEYFKKTLTTQTKVDQWRQFLGNPVFKMSVE